MKKIKVILGIGCLWAIIAVMFTYSGKKAAEAPTDGGTSKEIDASKNDSGQTPG